MIRRSPARAEISVQRMLLPLHCVPNYNNASKHNARSLLHAYGVLRCLYEVLLHAEGEDAIFYAEAAFVAASLVNNSVEELDSVHFN